MDSLTRQGMGPRSASTSKKPEIWAFALLLAFASPGAEAKPHSKAAQPSGGRMSPPEVYSATEEHPPVPLPAIAASVTPSFDEVPGEQRAPIARRLAIIEKLLVSHGRAYDYRNLTLTDLEAILAKLEAPRIAPVAAIQPPPTKPLTSAPKPVRPDQVSSPAIVLGSEAPSPSSDAPIPAPELEEELPVTDSVAVEGNEEI